MSSVISAIERQQRLYCTPPHITKALLKRECFPGSIWEPAAGRGDIVKALLRCRYPDVMALDIYDWKFQPCRIQDFLTSTTESDCIVTNPPFDLKAQFLAQAKRLARHKIAMLFPVNFEYTMTFVHHHESDPDFPWKALYVFLQPIPWLNVTDPGGKMRFAWFVFERGYHGPVIRRKISFDRNKK